jgi:23S rRNA (cytosine1962-C5)-methyltransferase
MAEIFLKSGREKSVIRHHPWLFSGSVSKVKGAAKAGETVKIFSAQGEFLAWAAYNPYSNIVCRMDLG